MKKYNRGFSIAEVVISIAVVLIVTLGTITIVSSSRTRTNEDFACTIARTYSSDALELFKLCSDADDYKNKLERFTELKFNTETNAYIYDGGSCILTITADFPTDLSARAFTATGVTKKGKTFLEVRYDKGS